MITQSDLARYRELKDIAEAASRQLAGSRQWLLDNAEEGYEIGPIHLRIDHREVRAFSYDGLVDVLGRAEADSLKARLAPRLTTFLTVTSPP